MQCPMSEILPPAAPIRATVDDDAIRELAHSLVQLGQLQSVGVKQRDDGFYEIVFGHRRFLAAQLLKWPTIRAELVAEPDGNTAELAKLVENTQREQLTPVEEAYALAELLQRDGMTYSSIAMMTGKSNAWVASRAGILNWPEDIQSLVHNGSLSIGVARNLARIADDELRSYYTGAAVNGGTTEAQSEVWVSAAILAAEGVARAASTQEAMDRMGAEPQVVDQQYTCFNCRTTYSWRKINMLVVCGQCQDKIATARPDTTR